MLEVSVVKARKPVNPKVINGEVHWSYEQSFVAYAHNKDGTAAGEYRPNFREAFSDAMRFLKELQSGKSYQELGVETLPF